MGKIGDKIFYLRQYRSRAIEADQQRRAGKEPRVDGLNSYKAILMKKSVLYAEKDIDLWTLRRLIFSENWASFIPKTVILLPPLDVGQEIIAQFMQGFNQFQVRVQNAEE